MVGNSLVLLMPQVVFEIWPQRKVKTQQCWFIITWVVSCWEGCSWCCHCCSYAITTIKIAVSIIWFIVTNTISNQFSIGTIFIKKQKHQVIVSNHQGQASKDLLSHSILIIKVTGLNLDIHRQFISILCFHAQMAVHI